MFSRYLVRLLVLLTALAAVSPSWAQGYLGEGRGGYQLPPGRGEFRHIIPRTHNTPSQRPSLLARFDTDFRDYMARYAQPAPQLTEACATGEFLPDRTLRLRFSDRTISIAVPNGKGLLKGREMANPQLIYFFHYEGSTSCRVYSRPVDPLGG